MSKCGRWLLQVALQSPLAADVASAARPFQVALRKPGWGLCWRLLQKPRNAILWGTSGSQQVVQGLPGSCWGLEGENQAMRWGVISRRKRWMRPLWANARRDSEVGRGQRGDTGTVWLVGTGPNLVCHGRGCTAGLACRSSTQEASWGVGSSSPPTASLRIPSCLAFLREEQPRAAIVGAQRRRC